MAQYLHIHDGATVIYEDECPMCGEFPPGEMDDEDAEEE